MISGDMVVQVSKAWFRFSGYMIENNLRMACDLAEIVRKPYPRISYSAVPENIRMAPLPDAPRPEAQISFDQSPLVAPSPGVAENDPGQRSPAIPKDRKRRMPYTPPSRIEGLASGVDA